MLCVLFLGLWSSLPNTFQSLQQSRSCGCVASVLLAPTFENSRKKTTKLELVLLQSKGCTGGCAWNLTWALKADVKQWSRACSRSLAVLVLFIQLLFN